MEKFKNKASRRLLAELATILDANYTGHLNNVVLSASMSSDLLIAFDNLDELFEKESTINFIDSIKSYSDVYHMALSYMQEVARFVKIRATDYNSLNIILSNTYTIFMLLLTKVIGVGVRGGAQCAVMGTSNANRMTAHGTYITVLGMKFTMFDVFTIFDCFETNTLYQGNYTMRYGKYERMLEDIFSGDAANIGKYWVNN